jgi:hypothetical protein
MPPIPIIRSSHTLEQPPHNQIDGILETSIHSDLAMTPKEAEEQTRQAFDRWKANRKCQFWMPTSPHSNNHWVSIDQLPFYQLHDLAQTPGGLPGKRETIGERPSFKYTWQRYSDVLPEDATIDMTTHENMSYGTTEIVPHHRFFPRRPGEYYAAMEAAKKIPTRRRREKWERVIYSQSKNPLALISWEYRVLRRWKRSAKEMVKLEAAEQGTWKEKWLLWMYNGLEGNEYAVELQKRETLGAAIP